jgi:hypothetical protein
VQKERSSDGLTCSCGPCPEGFRGTGETGCDLIQCPRTIDHLDPNAGIDTFRCFDSGFDETCRVSCDSGYAAVGNTTYRCNATEQWEGNLVCTKIQFCSPENNPCDPVAQCTEGDTEARCTCPDGYTSQQSGRVCIDIDECGLGYCHARQSNCTNTPGGYNCGRCDAGYRRTDDNTCTDIPECTETPEVCDPLVTCNERQGSFTCRNCPTGYTGSGYADQGGCQRRSCGETPASGEGVELDCGDNIYFEDKCEVKCALGYGNGATNFTCSLTGSWIGSISCRKQPCDNPEAVHLPDNVFAPSNCRLQDTCDLECRPGFKEVGTAQLRCIGDDWTLVDENFECEPCDGVTEYQNLAGQTECKPVKAECEDDEYLRRGPTPTSDLDCRTPRTCIEGFQLTEQEATPTSDTVCKDCIVCSAGTYKAGGCVDGGDTICLGCNTCEAPAYPRQQCTSTQNARCETCPRGKFGTPGRPCQDWTPCPLGNTESGDPPNQLRDRRCVPVVVNGLPAAGRAYIFGQASLRGDFPSGFDNGLRNIFVEAVRNLAGADALIAIIQARLAGGRRREEGTYEVEYRVDLPEGQAGSARSALGSGSSLGNAITLASQQLQLDNSPSTVPDVPSASASDCSGPDCEPSTSDDGAGNTTLIIIIAAAAGGAVVLLIVILVCCMRRSSGADISGAKGTELTEANYAEYVGRGGGTKGRGRESGKRAMSPFLWLIAFSLVIAHSHLLILPLCPL